VTTETPITSGPSVTLESPASAAPPATGDARANEWRFAALYGELRQLAERQLRRSAVASISPTTLLHEAYLGMAGLNAVFPDRQRFLGYAARVMRGVIIDFVRERRALKRGAGYHITQLPTEIAQEEGLQLSGDLSRLSDVLDDLARHEPLLAEIVDLRYFCGFTFEDIAAQRGSSTRTVQRDWEKARVLLFQRLQPDI
jgi:RNA polymerase sigma factor (TIGR02999 family)